MTTLKRILGTILTIILACIILLVGVLALPKLFGYEIFAVQSGSMEPKYSVGSVIYVKPSKPEEIKIGDPITFYMSGTKDVVATHRVVDIDINNQLFKTKGDANEVEDINPQSFNSLIGKVVFSVPILGYLTMFIRTTHGMIIAITVIVAIILLSAIVDLLGRSNKRGGSYEN